MSITLRKRCVGVMRLQFRGTPRYKLLPPRDCPQSDMPTPLISISVFLLMASAVFGVLNLNKARGLRGMVATSESARQQAERLRLTREKEIGAREATVAATSAKVGDDQIKVETAEADLVKSQTEKQELQAKLRANEIEIAELKKRIEIESPSATGTTTAAAIATSLEADLRETTKHLEVPEQQKALPREKVRVVQERPKQLENAKPQRAVMRSNPAVRGTILAVNQAYNFVVLNLGGRQGVESNSEMLVLRGGGLIGKIRISSVDPATAIGDIVTSSLARGVQVQPGDIVIYAGTN